MFETSCPMGPFYEATFQLNGRPEREQHSTEGASTHGDSVILTIQCQEKLSHASTSQSATAPDIVKNLANTVRSRLFCTSNFQIYALFFTTNYHIDALNDRHMSRNGTSCKSFT